MHNYVGGVFEDNLNELHYCV